MRPFFIHSSERERLEELCKSATGSERLDLTANLAWAIRQVDNRKAVRLCEELCLFHAQHHPGQDLPPATAGVVALVHGEDAWMRGKLPVAAECAKTAREAFQSINDPAGISDSLWLEASVEFDLGKLESMAALLHQGAEISRKAGDSDRARSCEARILANEAYNDPFGILSRLDTPAGSEPEDFVGAWLHALRATCASVTGDIPTALRHYRSAFQNGLAWGNLRVALVSANNASGCCVRLGANEAALNWSETALELVRDRDRDMAGLVGITRIQMVVVLLKLGRGEEAHAVIQDAMDIMSGEKGSRNHTILYSTCGELALMEKDYAKALEWYETVEARGRELGGKDLEMGALSGKATALAGLGRGQAAFDVSCACLVLAREFHDHAEIVRMLMLQAEMYESGLLTHPDGLGPQAARKQCLEAAYAEGEGVEGYHCPVELLEKLGDACARLDDFAAAWHWAERAREQRLIDNETSIRNQAVAMRVRHETDKALLELEQQKEIARNEALRAGTLQEANVTLETIGMIGREVTASLDRLAVAHAIDRNVGRLMDAPAFLLYLYDEESRQLEGLYGREGSQETAMPSFGIDHPHSLIARVARSKSELVIDEGSGDQPEILIPGTGHTRSLMFAPLENGGRLIGVISLQSFKVHAYGERERSLFRAIAAYGAIALDNARNFSRLELANARIKENQHQLLVTEKMASLGRLTAGIAHEMNTPLAAVRAAVENLGRLVGEYRSSVNDPEVSPDDHRSIASDMEEQIRLARNSSERAASFIRGIKNQTRDSAPDITTRFDMVAACKETLHLLDFALRVKQISIDYSLDREALEIRGNPARFAQVITNLVNNAIDALPDRGGQILISLADTGERAIMKVRDNGCGMDEATRNRIFDPLFTTKRFGEGTGLGLTLVRDIMSAEFGGTIAVQSSSGEGTEFILEFRKEGAGYGTEI